MDRGISTMEMVDEMTDKSNNSSELPQPKIAMTDEERAEKFVSETFNGKHSLHKSADRLAELLKQVREEGRKEAILEIAEKQAIVYGESVMLGGKLITNEELYKQPTDYIKEARKEGYEDGFRTAIEKSMAMAEYHSGPSIQLVEKLKVLLPEERKENDKSE